MKFFYSLLFTLFVTTAAYSQQNLDTIYGNPKSVREKVEFLNQVIFQEEYNNSIFRNIERFRSESLKSFFRNNKVNYINYSKEFLENGLAKKEIWYNKGGSLEREFKYAYDDAYNLVEENETYYDGEYWLTKFHYNKSNKPIAMSYYMSDEPNSFVHWYMIRDKSNNLIETKRIDEEGENYSIVYELNNQGEVIRKTRKYIPNWRFLSNKKSEYSDSISILNEYNYDKHGNKILELNYNEELGKVYSKKTYKYNNQNNLIETKIFYGPNDSTKYRVTKYYYNEDGFNKFKEELNSEDDSEYKSETTFYNKGGFIIKKSFIENSINTITTFKYKFDKKGNWTKITKIVNDEPLYVWTRKIKYYKD